MPSLLRPARRANQLFVVVPLVPLFEMPSTHPAPACCGERARECVFFFRVHGFCFIFRFQEGRRSRESGLVYESAAHGFPYSHFRFPFKTVLHDTKLIHTPTSVVNVGVLL